MYHDRGNYPAPYFRMTGGSSPQKYYSQGIQGWGGGGCGKYYARPLGRRLTSSLKSFIKQEEPGQ